jgi:YidC/Oxa1 family membrane protein insertase
MENSRLYIFFGLSLAIIIGFYLLVPMTKPPAPPPARPAEPAAAAPVASGGPVATQAPASGPAPAPKAVATATPKLVIVESPLALATVDTAGGRLAGLKLKLYRQHKRGLNWGDLIPFLRQWIPSPAGDDGVLVEMVRRELPGEDVLGLEFLGDDALTKAFEGAVFRASADSLTVPANGTAKLTLTADGPGKLTVEKQIVFHADTYVLDYTVNLINYGPAPRTLHVVDRFGQGPAVNDTSSQRGAQQGPIERSGGKTHKPGVGDIEDRLPVKDLQWLGIADAYFVSAARATTPVVGGIYTAGSPPGVTLEKKLRIPAYGIELPATVLEPGKMVSSQFVFYLGPKSTDDMLKFGQRLEDSLDLTLEVIAAPLLALLRWFHGYVGNFGVAIILLTVVVRVVLFPLTYRGMVSMKRMQKLQPRMTALREKFKNDKERMNREVMELYRRHKVNPLGGCLPIVVQIPIFFALYSALISAIELRHAPFGLWIQDLSAHDGLYLLPLVMGGTMFFQQRMTPSSMDPTQAKIMMWMPVVFTVFMLSFPSGLMVYWSTSNLLSITQQAIINRVKVPEPAGG